MLWISAGLLVPSLSARAGGDERGPFTPWLGEPGITEPLSLILARNRLAPGKPPAQMHRPARGARQRESARQNPLAPMVPQWPWNAAGDNPPTILPGSPLDNPQVVSPTQNFLCVTQLESPGRVPPNPSGAVGPSEFVVFVDGRFKAFDKATGSLILSVDADMFFDSVRGGSPTTSPQVRYDSTSLRWFLTAVTTAPVGNSVLIAASSGAALTAASTFTFFSFQQDLVAPAGNTGQYLSDPSLGIDALALYIGGNMLAAGAFVNTSAWVVNKTSLLGPGPIAVTAFRNLVVGGAGPFGPRGVDNPDPAANQGFFIGVDNSLFGLLQVRRISDPGGSPSISANLPLTVPATSFPIDVATSGGWPAADALDDRLYAARLQRNRWTGRSVLTTAQSIQVSNTGTASNTGGRNGSRWYQITNLDTIPGLDQAGTLFDPSGTNPRCYWIPTAAMSGQGHLALGCSVGAANSWIGCSTAGRLDSDPAGAIQSPSPIANGAGTYINNGGFFGRYSATCVDPVDDQSIWTFQEYMSANGVWGVRAARLIAPPPATPVSASPATVTMGQTGVQVVITGASNAGSGFYDTEPGLNRLQAAFGGTGIVITGAAATDPTHLTLTLDVSQAAAAGGRALVVTNPDGQQANSGSSILTVIPASICPSFTTSPDGQSVCAGGQTQFSASASGTPAPTYQWRKDAVPLINGGSISGADAPLLTINPTGPLDQGLYDCIATNACGTATSAPALLSVGTTPGIASQSGDLLVSLGQSAQFSISATGATGYQWRRNTVPLIDGGSLSGSLTPVLTINPVRDSDAGMYDCVASNGCGPTISHGVNLSIRRCYANCDGSTIEPILNVLDFSCFLNLFAAGDSGANCDESTIPPVLNVLDFACFLNRFGAGCS